MAKIKYNYFKKKNNNLNMKNNNIINNIPTTLPQEIVDLIIGTLLGDSGMMTKTLTRTYLKKRGRSRDINTQSIKFEQGSRNKEYLYFLFNNLREYTHYTEPKKQTRTDVRYGKENSSYYFSTFSSSEFYPFFTLFYKEVEGKNIKTVPLNILDLITPRALAY
jgi:LAGLIDADG DNA endonuclease family